MSAEAAPARHDLVWLGPSWGEAVRGALEPRARAALAEWFGRGLPAIACRRDASCGDALPLGVALSGTPRWRVSLLVDRGAVARVAPPPSLREAAESAPGAWRAPLVAIDRAARDEGLLVRVYGSLAWQHLSGRAYVAEGSSDVDLLVGPRNADELRRALALLRARGDGVPRLDGEVLLPRGRAVAWRELAAGRARVLVKGPACVGLEPVAAALGPLAGEAPWA